MKNILAIVWLSAVIFGSLLPASEVSSVGFLPKGSDKVIHLIMYMGLAFLGAHALYQYMSKKSTIVYSFLFGVVVGIVLEILQDTTFSGRSFEYLDIIANISGSILGILLFNKLLNQKLCFQT